MPPRKSSAKTEEPAAPKKGAARIFLVYGTDDLSATRKADAIADTLCPPAEQAFGLETINPDIWAEEIAWLKAQQTAEQMA